MNTEAEITMSPENLHTTRVLFALGKNIGDGWTGEKIRRTPGHLSDHSKITVHGAAEAIRQGYVDQVYFTVTNTAGEEPLSRDDGIESGDIQGIGQPMKAEADYMKAMFIREYPELADKVSVQDKSWDTYRDAIEAKRIIEDELENTTTEISLMTVGFHKTRAFNLFRNEGINVANLMSSDGILLNSDDPEKRKIAEAYRRKNYKHIQEQTKEAVANAVMQFPPLTRRISQKTKNRLTQQNTL